MSQHARVTENLQSIPGVGPSISEDLKALGFHRVSDLAGQDPEKMYESLYEQQGQHVDRCVLYVFRSKCDAGEREQDDGTSQHKRIHSHGFSSASLLLRGLSCYVNELRSGPRPHRSG